MKSLFYKIISALMTTKMTIGTDPEFFIKQKKDGKYLTAEHMFPGTKYEPHTMKSGAGLQTDNVAVEFASPVAQDGEELVANLRETFHELFEMLPEHVVLDTEPSAEFDDDQLVTEQAKLFGCSPSYDAWALKENEAPSAEATNMRSIGGHIHVGKSEGDGNDFLHDDWGKVNTIRLMDAFHGIISVVLDKTEAAVKRRELYGKAGDHRPTEYGVEYRTLSAFWLKSPALVMLMNSLTNDILAIMRDGAHEEVITAIGEDVIQNTINTGDAMTAHTIIQSHLLPKMSKDSTSFFIECSQKVDGYVFEKEWQIGEEN